jgi:hypothetical protein
VELVVAALLWLVARGALLMVRCMLYSEDGRIHAGGGRIHALPMAPACFLWRRSSLGRILVGAACSSLLAARSVSPALGAMGRVAGCGRGAVVVRLGGWGFYLPFPSPLLPVIFLLLVIASSACCWLASAGSSSGLIFSCSSLWWLGSAGSPFGSPCLVFVMDRWRRHAATVLEDARGTRGGVDVGGDARDRHRSLLS